MAAPTLVGTPTTNGAGATSISVTAPTGLASGDHQLVFLVVFSTTETVTTPSGWTLVGTRDNTTSGTQFRLRCYRSTTITATQAFTKSGTAAAAIARIAYRGGPGFESFVSSMTSSTANHALATATTTVVDSLVVGVLAEGTSSSALTHSMASPWTERLDYATSSSIGRVGMLALYDTVRATAGTQGGTVVSSSSGHGATFSVVLAGTTSGPTAPTVNAGADVASHTVGTLFSRTATENDNGATITNRAWTITAGPAGVGSQIGTAAALSWTPTTMGTYTLQYEASNSAGLGTDTMQITVAAAVQPPGAVFDLTKWKLTTSFEDPSDPGDADEVLQPELDTYTDENFYLDGSSRMVMATPVVGETTGGSSATRYEFREMEDGQEADWTIASSGLRRLTVTGSWDPTSITGGTGARQEVICGQVHGLSGTPPIYLSVEHTTGTPGTPLASPRLRVFRDQASSQTVTGIEGLTATTVFTYRMEIGSGRLKLWACLGDRSNLPVTPFGDWAASQFNDNTGCYIKVGSYHKTTVASGSSGEARATIEFFELIQPGDEPPIVLPSGFMPFFAE